MIFIQFQNIFNSSIMYIPKNFNLGSHYKPHDCIICTVNSCRELTREPHLAGTERDEELAHFIKRNFQAAGFDNVQMPAMNFLLSRPDSGNPNLVRISVIKIENLSIIVINQIRHFHETLNKFDFFLSKLLFMT